jgi:hypothetical protein
MIPVEAAAVTGETAEEFFFADEEGFGVGWSISKTVAIVGVEVHFP